MSPGALAAGVEVSNIVTMSQSGSINDRLRFPAGFNSATNLRQGTLAHCDV